MLRQARETGARGRRAASRLDMPWARKAPARFVREGLMLGLLAPLIGLYIRRRKQGTEAFEDLEPPVVMVANHASHLDTPVILRTLPRRWRNRTVVAAAADYFYKNKVVGSAFSLVFNTVPLDRKGGGLKGAAAEHLHRLLDERWSVLLFPEGTRSRDGGLGRLRAGAAVLAAEHDATILPVYVNGTHEAMPPGQSWPKRLRGRVLTHRHRVVVRFGKPIRPEPDEDSRHVIARVQRFFEQQSGMLPALPPGQDPPAPAERSPASAAPPPS